MQRDAAGIATDIPIINLAPIKWGEKNEMSGKEKKLRFNATYIAPNGRIVDSVIMPNHRVDKVDQQPESCPRHVETCSSVPRYGVGKRDCVQ